MDADDISDAAIAVMCDVARASGFDLDANKQSVVDDLVARGLVARTGKAPPDPLFEVTPRGQRALDARGVGVNEA
jgi:hypothetical protein